MKKYFEDFPNKFTHHSLVEGLSTEEIIKFAREFDPQRFHISEVEAKQTHFGGLVASGFQTQLLCFRPFCDDVLLNSWAVGAPGIDRLKWIRPWYPNEPLSVNVELLEKRISSKRKDRGYLQFRLRALAGNKLTLEMTWSVIMLTREGADQTN